MLKSWLARPEKYKWLSHDITNEILELMAHAVVRQLVHHIKELFYFSVMLDETADISTKEQISICIRNVEENFSINEVFLGFYVTDSTKSDALFNCLMDVLRRFDLPVENLRGQCYDGAKNMSGHISGLQTRVREQEDRALYVHCRAHSLNLVAQESVEDVAEIRNVMNLVQRCFFYCFYRIRGF